MSQTSFVVLWRTRFSSLYNFLPIILGKRFNSAMQWNKLLLQNETASTMQYVFFRQQFGQTILQCYAVKNVFSKTELQYYAVCNFFPQ